MPPPKRPDIPDKAPGTEPSPASTGRVSDSPNASDSAPSTDSGHGSDAAAKPPAETAPSPDKTAKDAVVGSGEFRSSADRRTGLISGIKGFSVKKVTYANVNGIGIFEGDIALGPVEKLQKVNVTADTLGLHQNLSAAGFAGSGRNIQQAVAITGQRFRWPGGLIPYEVQPDIQPIVEEAIQHWREKTSIQFVARTPANAAQYPNYVSFEVGEGCFSAVGMQGGSQLISIGLGCGVGQAIHEIGHAVGLWHEQSREDRDQFVRIAWENILPNMEHNFDQHITDGDDIGAYDYASVMHYPPKAFSSNGLDTIVALSGQPIGQRDGLSESDIAAVLELYPGSVGVARHLYTSLLLELAKAIKDQGYRSEGIAFYGWSLPLTGTVPLYKLSNGQGSTLYTTSSQEAYQAISDKGYKFDSAPCYVFSNPAASLAPLFRLDLAERDSLFTTSLAEAERAAAHGYAGQGVAGHVLTSYVPGTVPVYRLGKAG